MTKEEQLITFLLSEYENSKNNIISVSKKDLEKINLSEQEIIKTLYTLETDGLVHIKDKSMHDDLSRFWNISLKSSCLHYFDNKQAIQKQNRNNWIQFWIPVSLSGIAIIVSIVALVLGL